MSFYSATVSTIFASFVLPSVAMLCFFISCFMANYHNDDNSDNNDETCTTNTALNPRLVDYYFVYGHRGVSRVFTATAEINLLVTLQRCDDDDQR